MKRLAVCKTQMASFLLYIKLIAFTPLNGSCEKQENATGMTFAYEVTVDMGAEIQAEITRQAYVVASLLKKEGTLHLGAPLLFYR